MPVQPLPPALRPRRRSRRRWLVAGLAVLVVLVTVYPFGGGWLARRAFLSRVAGSLGRTAVVEKALASWWGVTLRGVAINDTHNRPQVTCAEILVPWGAALGGRSPLTVRGLKAHVQRGGDADDVQDIIDRLRGRKSQAGGASSSGSRVPALQLERGALELQDETTGVKLSLGQIDGLIAPGDQLRLQLRNVKGALSLVGGDGKGPSFGASSLDVRASLRGNHLHGYPSIEVVDGFTSLLPRLELTGIRGRVVQDPEREHWLTVDLNGSYGGAHESLWKATGRISPRERDGTIALRAERFTLDRVADVLPSSIRQPSRTSIDASFRVSLAGDAIKLGGELDVAGLTIDHDALASSPIEDLSLGLAVSGRVIPSRRRLELEFLDGRVRELSARLSGVLELEEGQRALGSKLRGLPRLDITLNVPRLPCMKLLRSVPEALTPRLQGFELAGQFEAQVLAKIDYRNLDALELRGKVGIDGCRVLRAPDAVRALLDSESILMSVEVPKAPWAPNSGGGSETETMTFSVGHDNPDFAPFSEISPHLVSSIMTTEDNGFFRHRGWVSSEFKSALRRNLEKGSFRLGASSITMQMVKNVLLSHEKTLSRKLQELFLVWYVEQHLPKERILELYFNAIEFGPRIYGIGRAARHYFGKRPAELTPMEAAFFSSILPSPKRRYVQYCHGSLTPQWDRYVRRILAKVHERGRLSDADYAAAVAEGLTFDRTEATFSEKQCTDWVKHMMTARPEPAEPALEADAAQ